VDAAGRTPLHEAAAGGHPGIEQALVAKGANVSVADNRGDTPIHMAAAAGSEPLVRLLVQTGADINIRNAQGRTPLHFAVTGGNQSSGHDDLQQHRQEVAQMLKLLLDLGAAANLSDSQGETPLDVLTHMEGAATDDPRVDVLKAAGGRWSRYQHRHADDTETATNPASETMAEDRRRSDRRQSTNVTAAIDTDRGPIRLSGGSILIGRSAECQVRYRSLTLSRRHAKIEPNATGYIITDLGSHNGTKVDGHKISGPHQLEVGQMIGLGSYEFEFDGSQIIPSHGELAPEDLARERQPR